MQLSKGQSIDAWGNKYASGTITQNERSLILSPSTAPGYAGIVKVQAEIVSGTLVCRPH